MKMIQKIKEEMKLSVRSNKGNRGDKGIKGKAQMPWRVNLKPLFLKDSVYLLIFQQQFGKVERLIYLFLAYQAGLE